MFTRTRMPGLSQDHTRHLELCRAIQICRLTATRAMSLEELAEALDCSARTIRRGIYALRLAGVDITGGFDADRFDDVDSFEPGRAPLSARRRRAAVLYRLDRRAWSGMLFIPADGVRMADVEGGAR